MTMLAAFLSSLHLLTLAFGLGSVFLRGVGLRRALVAPPSTPPPAWMFMADNVWGLAALSWIGTGLLRVFLPVEKGWGFYGNSTLFWVKMGLLATIVALELYPMVTLIRWRLRQARGLPIDLSPLPLMTRLNDAEVAITLLMPFVASMMARGLGFG